MSREKPIEKLDPNFKAAAVREEMQWRDARELLLEGQGWAGESEPYCRLPNRAEGVVRDPVWELSRHSAGLRVRFVTDAPKIAARWAVRGERLAMSHMPATGVSGLDLYARDGHRWRWAGAGRPAETLTNEVELLETESADEREYSVYLPLYNGTNVLEIGVSEGAILRPAPADARRPICFYGTSITQGGCASRPGMAYPAILGRWLNQPAINLGFSGNGKGEPEIAALLAELDPAVYVIDCLPNMSVPEAAERLGPLLETLRAAHPNTPLVLVENVIHQDSWLRKGRNEPRREKNAILRALFQSLQGEGDNNLYYVPCEALLGADGEGTVDGAHPTDLGFLRIAEALEPVLRNLS